MKKKETLSILAVIVLAGVVIGLLFAIGGNLKSDKITQKAPDTTVSTASPSTTQPAATATTAQPSAQTTVPQAGNDETTTGVQVTEPVNSMPQSAQEIIDKYTLLVDKFKKEKPAYTKKEYQALPEEYRNFGSAVNFLLKVAANYMVAEEDAEELIRPAGAEEILYDVPIHGTEKGCTLTNYDAVEWAKCEDLGDGTYKISFSLKEEVNAEPTPADTLVPPSAHGAVMQPMSISDIKAEVDKVISGIPGITLNSFDLIYRDCVFSCVYNPKTDEVKSITHNIVIDIGADVDLFSAKINGSARLLNDMLIYDITW